MRDVVVLGSGIIGSFAAKACADDGAQVSVLDTELFGNSKGSSVGASRRCNIPYATPPLAQIAERSRDTWADIRSALPGDSIDTGLLCLPERESQLKAIREQYLSAHAPHEILDTEALRRRGYPLFLREDDRAIFDPDAFLVRPESVLSLLAEQLNEVNAEIVPARVTRIDHGGDRVVLHTADGSSTTASQVILCLGKWTNDLLERQLGIRVPVEVTKEEVFWFATRNRDNFMPRVFPTVDDHRFGFYVFPEFPDGLGVKIGRRGAGPPVADIEDDSPASERGDLIREYARKAMPDLGEALASKRCAYVVTKDGLPLIGKLEGFPRITFFAGCNGSSFKLGPELGRILASLALENGSYSVPVALASSRFDS